MLILVLPVILTADLRKAGSIGLNSVTLEVASDAVGGAVDPMLALVICLAVGCSSLGGAGAALTEV